MHQLHLSPSKLVEIFVSVDDFLIEFHPKLQRPLIGEDKGSKRAMNKSEVMSILIFFHLSGFRNFKTYYQVAMKGIFRSYFRSVYPYEYFISLQSSLSVIRVFEYCLCRHLPASQLHRQYCYNSTAIEVCHMQREKQHKVFKEIARKGKNSIGFFLGFQLHSVISKAKLFACYLLRVIKLIRMKGY
jgi:hypothetical protein